MPYFENVKKWLARIADLISVGIVCFICAIILTASSTVTADGTHNILNAYITINTAFLAILFASITINPSFNEKIQNSDKILKAFQRLTIFSGLGLFVSLISYYVSYTLVSSIVILFAFWLSSAITLVTVSALLFVIKDVLEANNRPAT
jgi:hypothetical protein